MSTNFVVMHFHQCNSNKHDVEALYEAKIKSLISANISMKYRVHVLSGLSFPISLYFIIMEMKLSAKKNEMKKVLSRQN